MRISASRITILLGSILFMSTASFSQKGEQPAPPLKDGMARIFFKRHASMLGAVVVHLVLDKANTLNYNACTEQKKELPPEKSNFDKAGNVRTAYLQLTDNEAARVAGR
jgi:hypothetical protein